ncbi:MAG: 3-oxoacyl-ACP synthase [Firmicutes bacterium]|nr:3-oxoacyl-ACP synthase [Bacillota bacterium]
MKNVKILGYGTYLPKNKVIYNGCTRYRENEKNQIEMAEIAAKEALKKADITVEDIDLIIFASAVPAQLIPATAVLLHEKMASHRDIPAFDINSSCTSFITALDTVAGYIALGEYEKVLIVSCDNASRGLNEAQKESFELFSDGAAAFVVGKTEDSQQGVTASLQKTFSSGAHSTEIRGGGTLIPGYEFEFHPKSDYLFDMKGRDILIKTIKYLPSVFKEFKEKYGIEPKDMDFIIPHQASKALSLMMEKLGIDKNKYSDYVDEYGNMVSVSVPFIFAKELEEGRIKKGDNVMLCGTAAGLTVNILTLRI